MNPNLLRRKPHDVVKDPSDIDRVTRVIRCLSPDCMRTVVEYGLHAPETRHSQGLPESVMNKLADLQPPIAIVEASCNHHGGIEYSRPKLNV